VIAVFDELINGIIEFRYLGPFHHALASWLYREEYLGDDVLERLKLPKAPKTDIKVLTDDEVKTLLSAINWTSSAFNSC